MLGELEGASALRPPAGADVTEAPSRGRLVDLQTLYFALFSVVQISPSSFLWPLLVL